MNGVKRPPVLIALALLVWAAAPALGGDMEGRYGPGSDSDGPSHTFLAETHFQSEDLALGLTYRYAIFPARFFGAFLHLSARPYYDARVEELRPGYKIVFDEFRYLVAAGLEEELPLTRHFGIFAGAGAGYTGADYEATSRAPEEGWTPLAQAGLSVGGTLEEGYLGIVRAGYRYADLRGEDKNWWYIALGVAF